METTGDQAERQTVALEKMAKDVDTLLLLAQLWMGAVVLGAIIWAISVAVSNFG